MLLLAVTDKGDGTCEVECRSPLTGKLNKMTMPVPASRIVAFTQDKRMIQTQLPELDSVQREFLVTGYTREDWDTIFR